jgi:cytochrome c oxidase subunit IV
MHLPHMVMAAVMITGSLYKAYLIVFEFMHMKYEARGLMLSVLLPVGLLIWAIISFLYEGQAWKANRDTIKEKDKIEVAE